MGGPARNQGPGKRGGANDSSDMNFINGATSQDNGAGGQTGAAGQGKNQKNGSSNNSEEATVIAQHSQPATAGSSQASAQQQMMQGPGQVPCFPNGNQSLEFEEFIEVIKDSCTDPESAENYLVFAFSMFDREK